jgi:hypothetical protein
MDAPWADSEIATLAEKVRLFAGCGPHERIDVGHLIKRLQEDPDRLARVTFIEVSPVLLSRSLARAEPKKRIVRYQTGLREKAEIGDPGACQVFLEEIGHIYMHSELPALDHALAIDLRAKNNPAVARMESEAEKFVFYCMASVTEEYGQTDAAVLTEKYGMTTAKAEKYVEHLRRTKNQIERTSRQLPAKVLDFLDEAKKRGHVVKTQTAQPPCEVEYPAIQLIKPVSIFRSSDDASENRFLSDLCPNCGKRTLLDLGRQTRCITCKTNQEDD